MYNIKTIRTLAVVVFVLTVRAFGSELLVTPISRDESHVIVGNEIRLQGGGQRVVFHIQGRD